MKRKTCAATLRRFGDAARKTCAAFLSAMLVVSALAPCALAVEVPDATMSGEITGNEATTDFQLKIDDSQIKVTAPTDVVFYVGADGDFICPSNAYIENGSIFGIEMWGVEVTPETGASYELTVSPNGGSALSFAENGLFVASDTVVDEDWAGTTPTKTDTMVRSQWSMAATDNQEDGTGKASGADYIALTFEGRTDDASILSAGSATKVASAAWHFKAGGVAGEPGGPGDEPADDPFEGGAFALVLEDPDAADGDTMPMVFTRSENDLTDLTAYPTYNGLAVTAAYTGFEDDAAYSTGSGAPWYSHSSSVTSVTFDDAVKPENTAWWFHAFMSCTSMDLAKLDTSSVSSMSYMFSNCSNLAQVDVSSFNTSNVTDMSWMFYYCGMTSLDLSSFDTSSVTDMSSMFGECYSLKSVDLSSFDTSSVANMEKMFNADFDLVTIYASDKWSTAAVTNSDIMFNACSSLKGGNGTAFDGLYDDATYARVDTPETPGYLTYKAAPTA